MNCREAQDQIFTERDSAPDASRRAALEGHVASCAACRKIRADLAATFAMWRTDAAKTPVPDPDREWYAVRRRMRGGVDSGAEVTVAPRRNLMRWIAIPVAAAAALALSLSVVLQKPAPDGVRGPARPVARLDSIELPDNKASTMVFVDDQSGWLIVWASDAPAIGGG